MPDIHSAAPIESGRRTRRDTARRAPAGTTIPQLPPGVAKRPFPPTKIVSDDQVEAIHRASLQILSEIGMDFLLPEAIDLPWAAHPTAMTWKADADPAPAPISRSS